ncbi:MAG: 2-C-methyl-D-erythritol 4-phosphate cytidylyltransferase [Pseudomonadota bacterium]
MNKFFSVIPAAGTGTRMAAELPKQYLHVAGKPVLQHVVETFLASTQIAHTYVVVAPDDESIDSMLAAMNDSPSDSASSGVNKISTTHSTPDHRLTVLRNGGASRRDTVRNGLAALKGIVADDDWVLVHDAARPGLSVDLLAHLIDVLQTDPVGGLLALPVVDTLKRADVDGHILGTVEREGLWAAQTPQMFRYRLLCEALAQEGVFTDEASAVEALGLRPKLVPGHLRNFKLTVPTDMSLAELYLNPPKKAPPFRIGQGYDCHALVAGRALIIGGVTIDHPKGLLGHSDADVLLHAITDALFGAAGLGDIGRHFSDTDAQFAGADSRMLLRRAAELVTHAGYCIGNVDATIIAQAPKMAPHIAHMVAHISEDLNLGTGQVNVKAKTNERLGYLGREEGIAAEAVVLLLKTKE